MDSHHSARLSTRRWAVAVVVMIAVARPTVADDVNAGRADHPQTNDAIVNAWRILRTVDCARCHGKDYEGLAAPSIVDYARTQSRDSFVRMVLDGALSRGMPAYRDNALIAGHIDDIYRYFRGRADGTIRADPRAGVDR
ncbi:c-type cytochrome [Paraburkholderia sp. ZP32-5]|uniref:c-type cytochrome n=1 Tax=Paraburkholderia sp. ZP32-5 TaxID=2883245 RepID=UPI001F195A6E|nr:c-type cytochrome [Paraburkholderia sp. ZP32-5]